MTRSLPATPATGCSVASISGQPSVYLSSPHSYPSKDAARYTGSPEDNSEEEREMEELLHGSSILLVYCTTGIVFILQKVSNIVQEAL